MTVAGFLLTKERNQLNRSKVGFLMWPWENLKLLTKIKMSCRRL